MKEAADIIEKKKTEIMKRWKDEIGSSIIGAEYSSDLVLLDHLPDLMDDLIGVFRSSKSVEQIMKDEPNEHLFKVSMEHGRHRSASFGFSVDQIIYEYIVFHKIVSEILISANTFSHEVSHMLKYAVETAMMFSSAAFNDSLNDMRQKLVRVLAHDLRNPVSSALLGVELMNRDEEKERFEKIKKLATGSLKRALDLIEGLLETVSIEAGEGMTVNFKEVDLMEYIKPLHFEASEIYTSKIELQVTGDDDAVGIFDGAMIRRVLENFLTNALKYGKRDAPVSIIVNCSKDYVTLKVHNHGKAIPEEKRNEIFKFLNTGGRQNKGNMKSWGIGLALAKAVIEAHDGKLNVESSNEEGTSFEVVLHKHKNKPGKTKAAFSIR